MMMSNLYPAWLPDMFPVNPWTDKTYDLLYQIFRRDFLENHVYYQGNSVWFFREKENGKEIIFWHLTSHEVGKQGGRIPDPRRAERLPWARAMIDNCQEPEILAWDYLEGNGDIKTYIWLKDYDYLIIMKKYQDSTRRLVTAFWIEYVHFKEKLIKKYKNRIQ
ncbi:MAG: hypothetical protein NUV70_08650 [Caldiserica bacterium]|nr:hypothetical protein [Caldisericota bacterium]